MAKSKIDYSKLTDKQLENAIVEYFRNVQCNMVDCPYNRKELMIMIKRFGIEELLTEESRFYYEKK